MLYDDLVHSGKVGMTWSDEARNRNRGRRRRRRSSSWAKPHKPAHEPSSYENKTRLKKPGSGLTSRSNGTSQYKPRPEDTQSSGWSKPSANTSSRKPTHPERNDKDKYKKPKKQTTNSSVKQKAFANATEKSKKIKMKRGK